MRRASNSPVMAWSIYDRLHRQNQGLYLFVPVPHLLICTLLYGAAYLLSFEPDIGYFKSTALLPVISGALTVAPRSALSFCLCYHTQKAQYPPPGSIWSRLKAGGVGCALGFWVTPPSDCLSWRAGSLHRGSLFCLILGALSPLYFLPVALGTKKPGGGPCRLYPDFLGCYNNVRVYTNKYVAMNSPIKVSFMMATLWLCSLCSMSCAICSNGDSRAPFSLHSGWILVLSVFALPTLTLAAARIYVLKTFAAAVSYACSSGYICPPGL